MIALDPPALLALYLRALPGLLLAMALLMSFLRPCHWLRLLALAPLATGLLGAVLFNERETALLLAGLTAALQLGAWLFITALAGPQAQRWPRRRLFAANDDI